MPCHIAVVLQHLFSAIEHGQHIHVLIEMVQIPCPQNSRFAFQPINAGVIGNFDGQFVGGTCEFIFARDPPDVTKANQALNLWFIHECGLL
ncbi:Uncharacterised protein [Vibrio cholerae]|nr:Uncharacterised protein [Vibrio cholerae]